MRVNVIVSERRDDNDLLSIKTSFGIIYSFSIKGFDFLPSAIHLWTK